jgi:hypothetical protein
VKGCGSDENLKMLSILSGASLCREFGGPKLLLVERTHKARKEDPRG